MERAGIAITVKLGGRQRQPGPKDAMAEAQNRFE
jgi:hypothetical protein